MGTEIRVDSEADIDINLVFLDSTGGESCTLLKKKHQMIRAGKLCFPFLSY